MDVRPITCQAFDNFPEICGKFPEILNFRKVYNPSYLQPVKVKVIVMIDCLHYSYILHESYDDAKCIVVTRVVVPVCPRLYAHTTARTRM